MRIIKIILLLLVFQTYFYSQSGWIQQNSGTNKRIVTCCFLNDLTGYAAGYNGTILKTTNGGSNWNHTYNGYNYNIVALTFINSSTGWAYLKNDSQDDSTFVLKTVNGGAIWNKYFVDTNFTIWDWGQLQFFNANTGYLASYMDLKKTTNGGINWHVVLDGQSMRLFFLNGLTGWISGRYGIRRTTDGGLNWVQQFPPSGNVYGADLYFVDPQKGFAIHKNFGGNGPLYTTTNGGTNWFYNTELIDAEYRSIQFINFSTGYMLAYGSSTNYDFKLIKTTNTGLNWVLHNINSREQLDKVFFVSSNTGWIVGDSGTILKTTSGGTTIGIEPISTEIPNNFSLSQNYPNPFNPVTKIRFDIPQATGRVDRYVKMTVYDLLGREVSVLVNEELKAGTYEIDFEGTNLPSGVYYYKLAAGNYVQTKRMVLLK